MLSLLTHSEKKQRIKKIGISLVVIISLVLATIMALKFVVDKGGELTMRYLIKKGKAKGIFVKEPYFVSVNLEGLTGIVMKDFSMEVLLGKNTSFEMKRNFSVRVPYASLTLESFARRLFLLHMKNIEIVLHPEVPEDSPISEKKSSPFYARDPDRIENGELSIQFIFNFLNKQMAAKEANDLSMKFIDLAVNGKSSAQIKFTGLLIFRIKDRGYRAKVFTVRESGGIRLIMDKAALKDIILNVETKDVLGPIEVSLTSRNPLRAPTLLRILNYARDEAHKAFMKNNSVPEDAYKHILWSYYLSKYYGEKFGLEVAEAHEVEDYDESIASNRMDRINDKIGVEYLIKGYPESSLLERCMNDPDVVKDAKDLIPGFSPMSAPPSR